MLVTRSICALLAGASTVLLANGAAINATAIDIAINATVIDPTTAKPKPGGADIETAISGIQTATRSFGATVEAWDGSYLGTIPIATDSAMLLAAIVKGKRAARRSPDLSADEGRDIGTATAALTVHVNETLLALAERRPDFDGLFGARRAVLVALWAERLATTGFSNRLIEKLPEALVPLGRTLADQINELFNDAVRAFGG